MDGICLQAVHSVCIELKKSLNDDFRIRVLAVGPFDRSISEWCAR